MKEEPYYPEEIRAKNKCFGCTQLKSSMAKLEKELAAEKKKRRRIESIIKVWANVINPDYKEIYKQMIQILGEKDD